MYKKIQLQNSLSEGTTPGRKALLSVKSFCNKVYIKFNIPALANCFIFTFRFKPMLNFDYQSISQKLTANEYAGEHSSIWRRVNVTTSSCTGTFANTTTTFKPITTSLFDKWQPRCLARYSTFYKLCKCTKCKAKCTRIEYKSIVPLRCILRCRSCHSQRGIPLVTWSAYQRVTCSDRRMSDSTRAHTILPRSWCGTCSHHY